MKTTFNLITGILFGLAPLAGVVLLAVFIYDAMPQPMGMLIIGSLILLAIWIGVRIFKYIQVSGPIDFMTAANATPGLDNLEPEPDSVTKRREANELANLYAQGQQLFKGGSITIYGDWYGEPYEHNHKLVRTNYNENQKQLTLEFGDGAQLDIIHPRNILESPSFLKVIDADRVTLTIYRPDKSHIAEHRYFLDYQKHDKHLHTSTNVDWYKPTFSTSLSAPAVMLYGRL
ncbi:MAG: hypothetical protein KA479_04295 [Saprospiraceae bacterium]|nr:hypothetical protein [Saprospiraceae bacterium]